MTVDQEMFQEIHTLISEFPELHHQSSWQAGPEERNTCGTTRCIAGWAVWLKARELKLISRKREMIDYDMLEAVADHMGVKIRHLSHDGRYEILGAAILGLDHNEAASLFYDMVGERAVTRVKSYAERGHDLSTTQFSAWS